MFGTLYFYFIISIMASFSLLITKPSFDKQDAYTAYRFASSAIELNHVINGVFFYQGGVHNSNSFQSGHADELNLFRAWKTLSTTHNIPLLVCVTAANRRGVINQLDAEELDLPHFNLTAPFTEVGLGDLVNLLNVSDRVIQF